MTTDPTPPTPETLVADALNQPGISPRIIKSNLAEYLLAHAPLRDALTRGLALTPERLAAALMKAFNDERYFGTFQSRAIAILAALTPEATDAAE